MVISRIIARRGAGCALVAIICVVFGGFSRAVSADQGNGADDRCRPAAVLAAVNLDEEMSRKLMARTVEGLLERLGCDLPKKSIEAIREDPTEAEMIIRDKSPECYEKMKGVYAEANTEGQAQVEGAVVDALMAQMSDMDCGTSRGEVEALIHKEYRYRRQSVAYMSCVVALHQLRSAEEQYKLDNADYTDDISKIASYVVPGGDQPSASAAVKEIAKACCSAANCSPEDNAKEAWNADFGIDLSDDDGFLLYGYPIGGPGCLIMVAPDRDDPDNFTKCLEEDSAAEKEEGGEGE